MLLLAAVLAIVAPAASGQPRTVSYRGRRVTVPAGWPVYRLRSDPTVCVRFDRHALYLGAPGPAQRCPAHAVGRTEAILIEPAGRHGARVVVSWNRHPGVVEHALGVRSLGRYAADGAPGARARAARATARATASKSATIFTGLGFDACAAPSSAQMQAWLSSPYRAVGVYIGGAERACAQPNLTAAWVGQQAAAGWHLIPTYVGLQAPGNGCGCAAIASGHAKAQGTAAATDAVNDARQLGLGAATPIYYDMEGYAHTAANTSAVLAFLSAWTTQLHALGYLSGVYSSVGSGIADLVAARGTSFPEPDDIWIADWNGAQTTSDPAVPPSAWSAHQRLHQYDGGRNRTYGGVTLNVDSNYLDGATALPRYAPLFPDGTFVQVSGSSQVYRIAGGAPLLVTDWSTVGGPQQVTVVTQQQFDSLPPVPADGTFLATADGAFYRVAGGAALPVTDWTLFGGVQPSVTIDPWDLENTSNPASHLLPVPRDGTVVQGLPSGEDWSFSAGRRVPRRPNAQAVAVEDAALAAYPVVQCVVPSVRGMTVSEARAALRRAYCTLGKVHRPRHRRRGRALYVVRQFPGPGRVHAAWWRVGVRVR